jgi:hypothetical protein
VRRPKAELQARVNGQLTLRYERTGLTSYAGLEFVRRWLHRVTMLRRELATALPPSDYGVVGLVLVVLALLLSGGRRLRHLRYLDGDPLIGPARAARRLPRRPRPCRSIPSPACVRPSPPYAIPSSAAPARVRGTPSVQLCRADGVARPGDQSGRLGRECSDSPEVQAEAASGQADRGHPPPACPGTRRRGCLAPAIRGVTLEREASDLATRTRALAASSYCATTRRAAASAE